MKARLEAMLTRYRQHHTHPVNRATHAMGIPALAVALPLLVVRPRLGLALGAAGLGLQLVGHAVERNTPLFFHDPRFVVVGATWFGMGLVRRITGWRR